MVDVLLDAFAIRLTQGYAAAEPTLTRALELVLPLNVADDEVGRWLILERVLIGLELWDAESSHALAARQAQFARDTGAPLYLRLALNLLARNHVLSGELTTAALMLEEDRLIGEATGNPPIAYAEMMLAAWRGEEAQAAELIEATWHEATAGGLGRIVDFASYASSVLYNGLGRHDAARDAAWHAFERDHMGYGPLVLCVAITARWVSFGGSSTTWRSRASTTSASRRRARRRSWILAALRSRAHRGS